MCMCVWGGRRHVTHFVACCCILGENPRPARMTEALIRRENNSFLLSVGFKPTPSPVFVLISKSSEQKHQQQVKPRHGAPCW